MPTIRDGTQTNSTFGSVLICQIRTLPYVLCYAKGYALHLLARHHCRSRQVLQAEASRCVMRKILSLLVDLTISILLAQVPSESGEVRYQTDPKHSSCFTPSFRPDSSVAAPLWALSAVPQALSLNRG